MLQYILVSFYSEMEIELAKVIRKRLDFNGDEKLSTFVYNLNEKMIKRAKTTEIRDFLKNFGCSVEDILPEVMEPELSYYGNAIASRHQVAHAEGAKITLNEFEKALEAAKNILSSVEKCIR